VERASINLIMVGNGQGLGPALNGTAHFDVAASLSDILKPKSAEDPQDVAPGENS
jgi:hypothetical protein